LKEWQPAGVGDGAEARSPVVVLIPLFNDWESFVELVPRLDAALARHGRTADILLVDDGSTAEPPADLPSEGPDAIRRIEVLSLRRNLGHQRAIAIGLAYAEDRLGCETVVVMDGDGEDSPDDVPRLLERLDEERGRKIVFAERTRRSESMVFRIFYALYKFLHVILTGKGVRVGNFSAIPRSRLESLVVVSELWNHYAAAAFHSRQPYCTIPTHRGKRLRGRTTMNFVSLVAHGLSAISVYSATVGVRLLVISIALAIAASVILAGAVALRITSGVSIPDWAFFAAGILGMVLTQAIMLTLSFSFIMLAGRHGATSLPRRDYAQFIRGEDAPAFRPATPPADAQGGRLRNHV